MVFPPLAATSSRRTPRQPFIRLVRAAGNTIPNSNEKPILHSVSPRAVYACTDPMHNALTRVLSLAGPNYRRLCMTDKATFPKWATSARCLFDYRLNRRLSTQPETSLFVATTTSWIRDEWELRGKLNIETWIRCECVSSWGCARV